MRAENVFVFVFVFVNSSIVPAVRQLVVADGVAEVGALCWVYGERHCHDAVRTMNSQEMCAEKVFVFVSVYRSIVPCVGQLVVADGVVKIYV